MLYAPQEEERNRLIGDNLRKYRLLKGLTQEELAEGLCSVSQLSKVENGKTSLKRSLLKQMANRLGVTIERIETSDALLEELSEQLQLARDARTVGHYEKSLELVRQVVRSSRELGYRDLLLDGMLLEVRLLNQLQDFDRVISIVEQLMEDPLLAAPTPRVLFLFELGWAHEHNGNKLAAYDAFCRADEEFENLEDNQDVRMQVCFSMAKSHFSMNNYRSALRYAEKAERLATELSKHLWRIRSTYMKATFLRRLDQTERAEKIFLTALKEAEDNSLLLDVAIINNNMGQMFQEAGEYGQALAHLLRAKQVYELLGEDIYLLDTLLHLAELAHVEGDQEKAREHAERVLDITVRCGVNTYLERARAFRILGWVQAAEGKYEEYVRLLEQALEIYNANQVVFEAYDVAKELAESMHERGDARALEMYRQAIQHNERVLSFSQRR